MTKEQFVRVHLRLFSVLFWIKYETRLALTLSHNQIHVYMDLGQLLFGTLFVNATHSKHHPLYPSDSLYLSDL